LIKKHAARVNLELGLLSAQVTEAIVTAAAEVVEGRWDDQFVVDVFQTGSGTSTNMNANEVIAGRANELITGRRGGRSPVHPNDHVNLGQSSNDVIPSTIHIAALCEIREQLTPSLEKLRQALEDKSTTFMGISKIARTHLQDAVPIALGQEFSGYARQVALALGRIQSMEPRLAELAIGGTAVGTGMNTHPRFAAMVISALSAETAVPFVEAANHFEAQAARDASVEASGVLKTIAVSLTKIANDIRWLASGPRCGIGEIRIPPLQPGSSIMPGKVNPVMSEVVVQVAAQVIGNDAAITLAGQAGNFELNVMLPLIAHNLLQSISLLSKSATLFCDKCIRGIEASEDRCRSFLEQSLALATALVPVIGYDRAAMVAKKASETGRTIRETAISEKVLQEGEVHRILDEALRAPKM